MTVIDLEGSEANRGGGMNFCTAAVQMMTTSVSQTPFTRSDRTHSSVIGAEHRQHFVLERLHKYETDQAWTSNMRE
ncbi:Uncharacterized protein DAT39_011932 [Clarias magur]|uniref:Uncharacterized protein n=1 Tax=Clarias magur TaxID=1594786 RepID=A0A8J4UN12_CLAMG|nr:Uncharacterized protein DAT39_011932 [Clarias magur]